jgi:signal transduction histidine kinase
MTSLRHKLLLGFGGLLLILAAVSSLTMVVLTRYSRTLERVFRENYDSAVYCDGMKLHLDQLDARAQRLLWDETADLRPAALAVEMNPFESDLHNQLGNCTLPGETQLTQHIADVWQTYRGDFATFVGASPDQRRALYRNALQPRFTELRSTAQRIADMNMRNMVSVDGQVKRTMIDVRNALLVLVAAGAALAALLVGTVAVSLHKPIQALTRSARQIESGDLDLNLNVHSNDEMGQLAEAFNAMASRLREFRRLDNQRLLRTQQTTQLAIDSLPDAVIVLGPHAEVEIANLTARTHFHINPGEPLTAAELPWLDRLYEKVRRDRTPVDPQGYKTAVQLFDDGRERFLLPHAVPMFDDARTLIGVTVILVDVTRLRQADELKSGLVSMVSHELRTPLTSIRMAVGLATSGKLGAPPPRMAQVLAAARDDAERLYRIIENLLSMSRIEAGEARFQFAPMSPEEIVVGAVEPLRSALDDHGVKLKVDVAPDLPDVRADASCIGLALTNLLTNAMKFSPRDGDVTLSVARDGDTDALAFRVTDTGPGVPPEFANRIFEKFFRIPRPGGPTGAGLGLSIAKEIVVAHHGRIGVEPAPNGATGSTFYFTLPVATAPAPLTADLSKSTTAT